MKNATTQEQIDFLIRYFSADPTEAADKQGDELQAAIEQRQDIRNCIVNGTSTAMAIIGPEAGSVFSATLFFTAGRLFEASSKAVKP